jgi:hypothetical protein
MPDAPALYPTPARRLLARCIDAGEVRHYDWTEPLTVWTGPDMLNDRKVTADVAELVLAELANYGPDRGLPYTRPELTDAGRAWLAAAEEATP